LLAGFQPVLRIGALAVHAHLAFADDALDVAERQAWKARLEEAIEPHVGFVAETVTVCTPVEIGSGAGGSGGAGLSRKSLRSG
jgi:hypothetical protein